THEERGPDKNEGERQQRDARQRQQVLVALLDEPVQVQRQRHEQQARERHGRGPGHEVELVPAAHPFAERERAHALDRGRLREQQRQRGAHSPSAPSIDRMASRTNAMWVSRSTPSSAAPFRMSSRFTLRAKPVLFSFFFTDSTSTAASFFSGVTSAHATRNPDSSSHANSAC